MAYEPELGDLLLWGPSPAGIGMVIEKSKHAPRQCRIQFCDGALYWYGIENVAEAREKYLSYRKTLNTHGT